MGKCCSKEINQKENETNNQSSFTKDIKPNKFTYPKERIINIELDYDPEIESESNMTTKCSTSTAKVNGNFTSGKSSSTSNFVISNNGITSSKNSLQTEKVIELINDNEPKRQTFRKKSFFGNGSFKMVPFKKNSSSKISSKRMGRKTTTVETRQYEDAGKWYEETVETVVEEKDGGTRTTTSTRTKEIDRYNMKDVGATLDKCRSKSSSRSPSPTRPKSKGFLSKLKDKINADSDSDDEDDNTFAKDILKITNERRQKHGVKKLKLSKELSKSAQIWANKLASIDQLQHNPDKTFGENIYCVTSNQPGFNVSGETVVNSWYKEIKEHKFGEEPAGGVLKSGHFTQLVWKNTKNMGVARARTGDGLKMFIVAIYDPKGNFIGEFSEQVPPEGGFSSPKKDQIKSKATKKSSAARKSSSSSSSSSDSSSDEEDFAKEVLKSHNELRKKHGVSSLKLSSELSKYANDWARTIAKKDVMEHRPNNKYGENLYCKWSSNPNHKVKGAEAVESWYDEIKDFKFGREPSDLRAGHFTQVIWTDSKKLGVAMERSKSGKIYVVTNYDPPGNFVGSFSTKVPNLKK